MKLTKDIVARAKLSRDLAGARADNTVLELTRAWVTLWDDLAPQLAAVVADMVDSDDVVAMVANRRLATVLEQVHGRLENLTDQAGARLIADMSHIVIDAVNSHYDTLAAQLPGGREAQLLNRLDPTALDSMVARATTTIHKRMWHLAPDMITAMKAELTRGVAVGDNPRTVARRIMARTEQAFNGGLTRAATIARTEMLDVHRYAQWRSAQANSHLLTGRVWVATLDTRTCGSCLAMHGTEWPVDTEGPADHQNGRCVFIDRVKTWEQLGFHGIPDTATDNFGDRDQWWNNLDKTTQNKTLGYEKAEMIRTGRISWDDLIQQRNEPAWRTSYGERPLASIIAAR